jgi:hypothetical protein
VPTPVHITAKQVGDSTMQDKQQRNAVKITPLELTQETEARVRQEASEKAYYKLKHLNTGHRKVTEEELQVIATEEGANHISLFSATYGLPELSMPVFIEVFSQIWRAGGAIVSQIEKDAINKAQEQKLKDIGPEHTIPIPEELTIQATARKHAVEYLLSETITIELPVSRLLPLDLEISDEQRGQIQLYEKTYLKAYREYQPPEPPRRRLFGLF